MNSKKISNVLILCTGNSARSILGEVLITHLGQGRLRGFSAGSTPAGKVNPAALKLLAARGHDITGLRSKSWDEFAAGGAPQMDFIFTVCDNAAGETCPVWPGAPVTAHWGLPDPAAVQGSDEDIMAAFEAAYQQLETRINAFAAVAVQEMSAAQLRDELATIGRA